MKHVSNHIQGGEITDTDGNYEYLVLLTACKNALERFVYYKTSEKADGEDILQEVYLTALTKFQTLQDKTKFKAWIISIARNKIADFYRSRAKELDLPLIENISYTPSYSRMGITVREKVSETLSALADGDKQILFLYYIKNMPQADIAKNLGIPLGTVKSRLFNAKRHFRDKYPYPPANIGEETIMNKDENMKSLPEVIPQIIIRKHDKPVFPVKWEECIGWFIIPRLGERISWAMYDYPAKMRSETFDIKVMGRASIHGVEGVEVISVERNTSPSEHRCDDIVRTFVMQLTDSHARILSESHTEGDIKKFCTFLDGEEFLENWGFGEDNCGKEIYLSLKGDIRLDGDTITAADKPYLLDTVGYFIVNIGGKSYETVCVADISVYNNGVASLQYIDENGRTVLWRRFNKNDWAYGRYGQLWSEKLPDNERLFINGETYVHWYDCITDYIL